MSKQVNILEIAPKVAFWDVDIDSLDIDKDRAFIIPRTLSVTQIEVFTEAISKLESVYSPSDILNELHKTLEPVSNEMCDLVAKRYDTSSFKRFKV